MALRIEKRIGTILIVWSAALAGQPLSFEVRHQHLRGGAMGTLTIEADSIAFVEKDQAHSRAWKFSGIQQLSLGRDRLQILTYEDRKWRLGRDREFIFDRLPPDLSKQLYPLLRRALDQRFIAALADPEVRPLWQMDAKLRGRFGGPEGSLLIGEDRIEFQSKTPGQSRTWRYRDIDIFSSAGPFDLAITTLELSKWSHAGPTEFRFQLKGPLSEDRYNELWRRIDRSKHEGLAGGGGSNAVLSNRVLR